MRDEGREGRRGEEKRKRRKRGYCMFLGSMHQENEFIILMFINNESSNVPSSQHTHTRVHTHAHTPFFSAL